MNKAEPQLSEMGKQAPKRLKKKKNSTLPVKKDKAK